jgi:hypothetical protein
MNVDTCEEQRQQEQREQQEEQSHLSTEPVFPLKHTMYLYPFFTRYCTHYYSLADLNQK